MHIDFNASVGTSLGIEWELELVDRTSGELVSAASDILAELGDSFGGERPKAKHELFECCVELNTGICTRVDEALADLRRTIDDVASVADRRELDLMCSGTHPTSDWSDQVVSPTTRYARLIENMQWLGRRMQIFGVHVHVGVRSADKMLPMINALSAYVPHFLALSASSPFWTGNDTGLASTRSKVFEGLPTAGLPYQLHDWPEFETFMGTLFESGTITSIKDVWWDIRPHPEFGTVELRICDGLPTLTEVGMVAALAQCLVERLDGQLDRGYTLPLPHEWIVRENKWRAARYGLDAEIITDDSGATVPLRREIEDLCAELVPVADRLGCGEQLATVDLVLAKGASYQRQRAVAALPGGSPRTVVASLVEEFRAGMPA